jgi:hypothetical protein
MRNERFADFVRLAISRAVEATAMFENHASICTDRESRLYLFYLAGKKRVEMVQLMRLANAHAIAVQMCFEQSNATKKKNHPNAKLSEYTLEAIQAFSIACARRDVRLYSSLARLEEEQSTRVLHANLVRISSAYLADIAKGYDHFAAIRKLRERDTGMYAWPPRAVSRRFIERDVAGAGKATLCG